MEGVSLQQVFTPTWIQKPGLGLELLGNVGFESSSLKWVGLWPVMKGLPSGLVTTAYSDDGYLKVALCSALPSWGGSKKFSDFWQEENVDRVNYYTEYSEDGWATWITCSNRKIGKLDTSLNSKSVGKALQRASHPETPALGPPLLRIYFYSQHSKSRWYARIPGEKGL